MQHAAWSMGDVYHIVVLLRVSLRPRNPMQRANGGLYGFLKHLPKFLCCLPLLWHPCKNMGRLRFAWLPDDSAHAMAAEKDENEGSSITLPKAKEHPLVQWARPQSFEEVASKLVLRCGACCLQPHSNSFPSCDSICVLKESTLWPNGNSSLIALNFPTTVSGVHGLLPRPKHALRCCISSGTNAACRSAQASLKEPMSVFAAWPQRLLWSFRFPKRVHQGRKVHCRMQPKEQFVHLYARNTPRKAYK